MAFKTIYLNIIRFHPLLFFTISFMAGILLQSEGYAITTLIFCSLALFATIITKRFTWLLYGCGITLALATSSWLYQQQRNDTTKFYQEVSGKTFVLTGTIKDIQTVKQQRYTHQFLLNTISLSKAEDSKTITSHALISLYSPISHDLQVGDHVSFSDIKFKRPKNESFEIYLTKQGIIATSFVQSQTLATLIHRPTWSTVRWISEKKIKLFKALKEKMSYATFAFFSPLFLGIKNNSFYEKKLKEEFKWWGLSHYLARSGLHLMIFILLWKIFLRFIPLPLMLKQIILLIIAYSYFLFTWSTISFIRAFLSLLIYYFLLLFHQQINMIHILTLVTLSVLIYNPLQLFFLDFQLSFGLTLMLLLFNEIKSRNNY